MTASFHRLDDADLALLEIGEGGKQPLVQRLIWEIRCLRDDLLVAELDAEDARAEADDLREQLDELES